MITVNNHLPFLDIMQGIPLGLVFGSIPYMLKSEKSNNISYSQFGLFSLAGYPYSLKLLWSPLVDQIYSRRLEGERAGFYQFKV